MYNLVVTTETRICPVGNHAFEYETRTPGPAPVFCTPLHQQKAAAERARIRQAAMPRRTCARCKVEKSREEFGGVTNPYCRPCHTEYERERKRANGQQNPEYTRALNLRRYGLSLEQFDIMLAAQDGRCAICQTDAPGGQGWHVDHDHRCCSTRKTSCGRCLRGLLCSRCNIAIGNLRDDAAIIQAALDYVVKWRTYIDSRVDLPPDPVAAVRLPRKHLQKAANTTSGQEAASRGAGTEPAPSVP